MVSQLELNTPWSLRLFTLSSCVSLVSSPIIKKKDSLRLTDEVERCTDPGCKVKNLGSCRLTCEFRRTMGLGFLLEPVMQ